jgi:ribosomal protein S18 acetylase RimI-like enzyme
MIDVALIPMTAQDLEAFIQEELSDCAVDHVLDGTWSRREALGQAQAALSNVITWERSALTSERQRLWTAINTWGERVGWLWVKLTPPGTAPTSAFLCQVTVARAFRHQGYGRAILAALEDLLAGEGIAELSLNVCESNLSAKSLYRAAGYELAEQYPTMRLLRKCLDGAATSCNTVPLTGP